MLTDVTPSVGRPPGQLYAQTVRDGSVEVVGLAKGKVWPSVSVEEILDHPSLRGTPLAMLAAQCNKLSSKSPPPLADAAVGKGFHPWKKSPQQGGAATTGASGAPGGGSGNNNNNNNNNNGATAGVGGVARSMAVSSSASYTGRPVMTTAGCAVGVGVSSAGGYGAPVSSGGDLYFPGQPMTTSPEAGGGAGGGGTPGGGGGGGGAAVAAHQAALLGKVRGRVPAAPLRVVAVQRDAGRGGGAPRRAEGGGRRLVGRALRGGSGRLRLARHERRHGARADGRRQLRRRRRHVGRRRLRRRLLHAQPHARRQQPPALRRRRTQPAAGHVQVDAAGRGAGRLRAARAPRARARARARAVAVAGVRRGVAAAAGAVSALAAPLHGPRHLRLPQLPGGGAPRARRRAPAQEEHPQLPHPRLREVPTPWHEPPQLPHPGMRQGVRQDLAPEGALALAHGGAPVRVQLAVLRQALHALRRAAAPPAHAHGREALRVPRVQQALHALRPPGQAREDAQRRRLRLRLQEGQLRVVLGLGGRRVAAGGVARVRGAHAAARRREAAGAGLSPVGSRAAVPALPPLAAAGPRPGHDARPPSTAARGTRPHDTPPPPASLSDPTFAAVLRRQPITECTNPHQTCLAFLLYRPSIVFEIIE